MAGGVTESAMGRGSTRYYFLVSGFPAARASIFVRPKNAKMNRIVLDAAGCPVGSAVVAPMAVSGSALDFLQLRNLRGGGVL